MQVDRKTLNDWERKKNSPIAAALAMPLADAVAFLESWRRNNVKPRYWSEAEADEDGTLQGRLLAAQIRNQNAQAKAKEIKNAERLGELYEAADVELQVAELTAMIRGELESWADHLQNEWPAECRETVTERIKANTELLLRRMSQWRMGGS
jgi:phage terminase Nu1 subunit (DNA packaging protein)